MSHAFDPIRSTTHPHLVAELHYDPHPSPPECDFVIAYNQRSRYVLGTRGVTTEQMQAIEDGINKGTLIGLPVYAYVHGSVMLRAAHTNPFSCPWDSAQSGFIYTEAKTLRDAMWWPRLTKDRIAQTHDMMREQVYMLSAYLNGECYGYVIRNTDTNEALDSCWGYYGDDDLRPAALSALKQMEAITPLQMELFNQGE
jgi:hypothetical protein